MRADRKGHTEALNLIVVLCSPARERTGNKKKVANTNPTDETDMTVQ